MKKLQRFIFSVLLCVLLSGAALLSGCGPKPDGVTIVDSSVTKLPPPKMPDNPNIPPEARAGIQQRMNRQGAAQQQGRTK